MKRIKIIGMVLVAVFLLTSVISISALAKNSSVNEEKKPVSDRIAQKEDDSPDNEEIPISIDIDEANREELNKLLQEYKIDKSYSCGTFDLDGEIVLYWEKLDENGIGNPFDALKVRLDESGNIVSATRFGEEAKPQNTTVTKEKAENIALAFFCSNRIATNYGYVKENSAITSIETEYVKPNDIWSWCNVGDDFENAEPRLAYNVCIDGKYFVFVDAETGDIIGGDMLK